MINNDKTIESSQKFLTKHQVAKLEALRSFALKSRLQNLALLRSRVHFFNIFKMHDSLSILEQQNENLKECLNDQA